MHAIRCHHRRIKTCRFSNLQYKSSRDQEIPSSVAGLSSTLDTLVMALQNLIISESKICNHYLYSTLYSTKLIIVIYIIKIYIQYLNNTTTYENALITYECIFIEQEYSILYSTVLCLISVTETHLAC